MKITQSKFGILAAAQVFALAAIPLAPGLGASAAAEDMVVPPPVSQARAAYFAAHPDEWSAVMARAPKARMVARPATAAVVASPTPGTWSGLTHGAPVSGLSNPLLLTDGTVIMHVLCSASWYKLTPDTTGSYINGTWSQIADAPWQPLYFASQILNDGRVVGNGGEYDGKQGCQGVWQTGGGVYNPGNNTWTTLPPPSGWTSIGDAQSIILPNGKYMLADCCSTNQALLNPTTLAWTATGSGKADDNDEEGWALLHDGTVLTADAYVPITVSKPCGVGSEKYNPATGAWVSAGNATTQLSDCKAGGNQSYEVGPLVVRPGGAVLAFSGVTTGVAGTSVYNPGNGTWTAGPNLPTIAGQNYNLADAPALALPSGNVFFAASPGLFSSPSHFFEYNAAGAIVQRADTPGASGNAAYVINMLMLPTGQVLQTDFSSDVEIYTPLGTYQAAWQPAMTSPPTSMVRGTTYDMSAVRMNGVTHGVYGDDVQAATNFPLVQLTSYVTKGVYYAKTSYFSNRAVNLTNTGTFKFTVPAAGRIPLGKFSMRIIANGIPSAPVDVTITN